MNTSYRKCAVIGLGITGISVIDWAISNHYEVVLLDSHIFNHPLLPVVKKQYPQIIIYDKQQIDCYDFLNVDLVILSPGVPLNSPVVLKAKSYGLTVIGDLEIFFNAVPDHSKLVLITGTNGKSTVTALVGYLLEHLGYSVAIGGNYGIAALDLLKQKAQYYILELSSFQLDLVTTIRSDVAVLLNITEDHMDRYSSFEDYCYSKHKIFQNTLCAVFNLDDSQCIPHLVTPNQIGFTQLNPGTNQFGLCNDKVNHKLSFGFEKQCLLAVDEIKLLGKHNYKNVLAVLAILHGLGFSVNDFLLPLKDFGGLPHRMQLVSQYKGVHWINDSKATNPAATIAAVSGLVPTLHGGLILILGGDGKKLDFKLLADLVGLITHVICIGRDGPLIATVMKASSSIILLDNLKEAVLYANRLAQPGDTVLLSPGCASFDQYKNFIERGNHFVQLINQLELNTV